MSISMYNSLVNGILNFGRIGPPVPEPVGNPGPKGVQAAVIDYITLNVPPGAFSNVPLQTWSLSVRQS